MDLPPNNRPPSNRSPECESTAAPDSPAEHRAAGPLRVPCAVLTVSDSRTKQDDRSGALIVERLTGAGHDIVRYEIHPDEPVAIRAFLQRAADATVARAVLITGGSGIAARDQTVDTVAPLFEKTLPGFGEIFRVLSYEEVGAAAMLSRATAGVYRGMIVFVMPGSTNAVRLALDKLILPELGHLVGHL